MTTFRLAERAWPVTAVTDVDEDGFLLSVRLTGGPAPDEGGPRSFGAAVGASLGVRQHDRILTVGDLVLAIGPDDRLLSLEWRMGPAVLRPGPVAEPDGPAAALHVDAEWDGNGRADVPGRCSGVFERASRRLTIRLGPEPATWGFVADGFGVGLSATGGLASVFLRWCPLDLCALVGSG